MINHILSKLGFNEEEIKTYLFMLESGEQTAGNLARKLGVPRSSLYGFLRKLTKRELIIESVKRGVRTFTASPPEKIKLIFDQKIEDLKNNKKQFENILTELTKGSGKSLSPKFQLFEGKESVRNTLKDALLYSNIETESYWPIKSMIDILGQDAFRFMNKERIKRNIYTRAIWPAKQVVDVKKYPFLGVGDDFLREIRVAPKEINFEMGYWIYADKVLFVSSKKESFAFIIESSELAEMMRTQFYFMWKDSETLKVNPRDTSSFLKEVR